MQRVPLTSILGFACILLAGCTQPVPAPPAAGIAQLPDSFPAAYYLQAQKLGSKIFGVNSGLSQVIIYAGKDGPLARLGHEHVVASRDVHGYVDLTRQRADLYVPLDRLTVDEPALRAAAGLTTQLTAEAIAGTRQNMLNKVLEAEQFPFALIQVRRTNSNADILQVAITLHGKQQTFEIPAMIETLADGLKISGELQFRQSDFGITPFSILGGALQVQDQVHLRFSIVAGEKY